MLLFEVTGPEEININRHKFSRNITEILFNDSRIALLNISPVMHMIKSYKQKSFSFFFFCFHIFLKLSCETFLQNIFKKVLVDVILC